MGICHAISLKYQRGSAIVFAMGLSLLVVALAAALLLWLSLDIRRVQHLQDVSKRMSLLEIAEAMAAEKISTLPQDWDAPWEVQMEDGKAKAHLSDLSGRLNINTLHAQETENPGGEFFTPKAVIKRLLEKQSVQNIDQFLDDFSASHHVVLGVNTLTQIAPAKDFLYGAPPDHQAVNINATTPEVLSAILDLSAGKAAALLALRPYQSQEDLVNTFKEHELQFETSASIDSWLSVSGTYYVLETTIEQRRMMRVYSVFQRDGNHVTLRWRSWGTLP